MEDNRPLPQGRSEQPPAEKLAGEPEECEGNQVERCYGKNSGGGGGDPGEEAQQKKKKAR